MHPKLQLQLFGSFQIVLGGKPGDKVQQSTQQQLLLAYCLLNRNQVLSRSQIASALWPDTNDRQARTNLRQLIHNLRRSFPSIHDFVDIQPRTLVWRENPSVECDLFRFEDACTKAESASDAQIKLNALNDAIALHANQLLAGCYTEWLLHPREMLYQQYLMALTELATLQRKQRAYDAAIRTTQTLLHDDPLREAAYCLLMELHVATGDRAGAMRVFHDCAALLRSELGVEPSAQTIALYERLLLKDESDNLNRASPSQADSQPRLNIDKAMLLAQSQELVGRSEEWHQLHGAWQHASSGSARVFLIVGEAGMGKSRLAEELLLYAGRRGIGAASTRSYAAAGDLAYAPIAQWLRSEPLKHHWSDFDTPWLTEIARIVPEVLVEQPTLAPPEPLHERWQRKRLFEALAEALHAYREPLLLLLDDLQWCDSDTLEFIHFLLGYAPTKSLLIVGTLRPEEVDNDHPATEFMLALRQDGLMDEVELSTLSADETAVLASQTAVDELTHAEQEAVYSMAGGNPLYVVEMVRSQSYLVDDTEELMAPHAAFAPVQSKIPSRVYATIQRRLHALSPVARELAAVAATIGRAFSFNLLAAVSEYTEDAVVRGLDELWQRRIMRERGVHEYDFSHDRIRDVAYAEVGPAERRVLHGRVAEAMDIYSPNYDARHAGIIAWHLESAGLAAKAIEKYKTAGMMSIQLSSNHEGCELLQRGLGLIATIDDNNDLQETRTEIQWELLVQIGNLYGMHHKDIEKLALEILDAALGADNIDLIVKSKAALRTFNTSNARWDRALQYAEEILILVPHIERGWQQTSFSGMGQVLFNLGRFSDAQPHFDSALDVGRKGGEYPDSSAANRAKVFIWQHGTLNLWMLGRINQAQSFSAMSVQIALGLPDMYMRISTYTFAIRLQHFVRNYDLMEEYVVQLITYAEEYSYPFYRTIGLIFDGWHKAVYLSNVNAPAQILSAIESLFASGYRAYISYYYSLLSEAYLRLSNEEEATRFLLKAIELAERYGEKFWFSELYHNRGAIKLRTGNCFEAQKDYECAIDIAREQSAKSLELRATMSLARLWQEQDKRTEARTMLAEIYNWFTEGFEPRDLVDAKALLDELA